MLVGMRRLAIALVFAAGASAADPVGELQRALPAGWKVITTTTDLTIERMLPVQISGRFLPNAAHYGNAPTRAPASAPTEKLRLRYRTEPAWSAARLAQVTAANKQIYAELQPLRAKYKIDDIATGKGMPLPKTPDEQQRLRDYQAAYDAVLARITPVPECTLGKVSVFADRATYQQLDLMVVPEIAMREAYAVVELMKRRCTKL
jgi:hypothetical protein